MEPVRYCYEQHYHLNCGSYQRSLVYIALFHYFSLPLMLRVCINESCNNCSNLDCQLCCEFVSTGAVIHSSNSYGNKTVQVVIPYRICE